MKQNFALIGAAGYIAPRHLHAIKVCDQNLVAALDIHDSVGIIDSFFPDTAFFTEFERFDRHCEMLRRTNDKERIHYVTICSPNYLHDAHIRFALRSDANSICEKPLVLNPWNAEALHVIEQETGKKIYTILQLRHHPSIIKLHKKYSGSNKHHDIELTYITPRGKWYYYSWKGDVMKSGGVATNIGVHFFDMLIWIFGNAKENKLHLSQHDKAAGILELENATVKWFLSLDRNDLPESENPDRYKPFRSIKIDDEEIEFSKGFTDLHTISYREILNGNGFCIYDTMPSIEVVYNIRKSKTVEIKGEYHPFIK